VRSTFSPEDRGTLVSEQRQLEQDRAVSGIAADESQAQMVVMDVPDKPGVAAKIFGTLASNNISVDMIIQAYKKEQNTNDIAFSVPQEDVDAAIKALEAIQGDLAASKIVADTSVAKISIVGIGMIDKPGVAANMFDALADAGINIRMISTSEIKISCLIDKAEGKKAIKALHQIFFPEAKNEEPVLVDHKIGY
jgi:aspartate kinase